LITTAFFLLTDSGSRDISTEMESIDNIPMASKMMLHLFLFMLSIEYQIIMNTNGMTLFARMWNKRMSATGQVKVSIQNVMNQQ
jgi:hypothetical protein